MSLRFLLDANVLSEPSRERPNRKVLEKLRRFEASVATGSVVWSELLIGAGRLPDSSKKRELELALSEIAPVLQVLPFDRNAAEWYAAEWVRLEKLGQTPPFADGQIAAIASVNGLALVTNNERDFRRFRDLEVVNWHK